jgi:hypothetical protein
VKENPRRHRRVRLAPFFVWPGLAGRAVRAATLRFARHAFLLRCGPARAFAGAFALPARGEHRILSIYPITVVTWVMPAPQTLHSSSHAPLSIRFRRRQNHVKVSRSAHFRFPPGIVGSRKRQVSDPLPPVVDRQLPSVRTYELGDRWVGESTCTGIPSLTRVANFNASKS